MTLFADECGKQSIINFEYVSLSQRKIRKCVCGREREWECVCERERERERERKRDAILSYAFFCFQLPHAFLLVTVRMCALDNLCVEEKERERERERELEKTAKHFTCILPFLFLSTPACILLLVCCIKSSSIMQSECPRLGGDSW